MSCKRSSGLVHVFKLEVVLVGGCVSAREVVLVGVACFLLARMRQNAL